jgi:hypothetical protein
MNNFGAFVARFTAAPFVALQRSGPLGWVLGTIWVLYPFAIQTVIHPSDAVGFQAWIQGLPVAEFVSRQARATGLIIAVLVFVVLSLLHFGTLLLIYRRVQFVFSMWPLGLLLIGFVANSLWWLRTGYFDLTGCLAGLAPLGIIVVCEIVFEHLGTDFVFGKGNRPSVLNT